MKFYIGLGRLGCNALSQYHGMHIQDTDKKFYYIKTDSVGSVTKNVYIFPSNTIGMNARRAEGRNIINYAIYNGLLSEFFNHIKQEEKVELIFSLASFGEFGSSAIIPMIDYMRANLREQLKSCSVIAFNENAHIKLGFSADMIHKFQENTVDCVNDFDRKMQEADSQQENLFNQNMAFYLLDTGDMNVDDLGKCFEYTETELKNLNCRNSYRIEETEAFENKPDVFITYSSEDQWIVNEIEYQLKCKGLYFWSDAGNRTERFYTKKKLKAMRDAKVYLVVLSENSIDCERIKDDTDRACEHLKDGMIIIPFMLDSMEINDNGMIDAMMELMLGKLTLNERIQKLVKKIEAICSDL